MTTIQCPLPLPDESYERYAIRAHRALAKLITDPEDRNMLVEEVWRDSRGATEAEKMAADKMDPDRFERKANVCYFTEHETVDSRGKPRKYDLRKLVKIVRNANARIADVAAFPAIADGHTPAAGSGQPQPPVLGFVGNYRLGMLGRQKPKWAIFADEYHAREHAQELAKRPRRSVELWTFKDTGKSHFDPIAALGAEAPRLPLPVAFQMTHEGEAEVEKYTVAAPAAAPSAGAFPGGGNTHVKAFKQREPTKMALSDSDLAQIVGAISETPQWKYLDRKMEEESAAEAPAEEMAEFGDEEDVEIDIDLDNEPEPEGEMPEEPAAEMPDEIPGDAEGEVPGDEETADLEDLLAETDEEEEFKMSANQGDMAEKYSQLQASHTRLARSHANLRKQMVRIAKERADGHRKTRLMEIDRKFPGAIDYDEECQACLYSAGSTMSQKEFGTHVATIEKYAARMGGPSPMIPGGALPQMDDSAEVESYSAALTDAAVEICTAAASQGGYMEFEEGIAEARKRGVK